MKLLKTLSGKLRDWNRGLPNERKVYLHLTRSSFRFNQERRYPDVSVSLIFPIAEKKHNSVIRPLRSLDFVTEICRHECKNELLQKIRNSYLVEGTNTTVDLLICWTYTGNEYFVEMKFYIRGRNEPVLEPIWDNWKAEDIPELAEIIHGFVFDTVSVSVMHMLRNYQR